jgi:hypothetical protein
MATGTGLVHAFGREEGKVKLAVGGQGSSAANEGSPLRPING